MVLSLDVASPLFLAAVPLLSSFLSFCVRALSSKRGTTPEENGRNRSTENEYLLS